MMTEPTDVISFVGRVGDMNKSNRTKCFISDMSSERLNNAYRKYVSRFAVEMVKVKPASSLFNKHTSFSHHFNHKEFELVSNSTGLTLGDLLNFIPSCEMEEMLINEEDRRKRANYKFMQ